MVLGRDCTVHFVKIIVLKFNFRIDRPTLCVVITKRPTTIAARYLLGTKLRPGFISIQESAGA